MASVLGFDKKYGIKIMPDQGSLSWAGVRDKLVNGELDMAHVLYGLVYGVHLGIGGPKKDMAVLMTLNNNGQAHHAVEEAGRQGRGRRRQPGQADAPPRSANTPSRRPSPPARTRCGCTTGWPRTASTRCRTPRSSPCRRRRWWPTCASATWTASASASPGTTAPSSTASASPPPPRRTSGRTTRRRCWARTGEFVEKYPNTARAVIDGGAGGQPLDRRQPVEQEQDGRDHRRQVATSTPASTRSTSASWAATTTASARPGTTPTT